MSHSHESHMERALELARSVLGTTSPNPAVGCVIVKDGVVVGEGATQPPGGPHAEKGALAQAGKAARGATMYVSLEPCSHYGRTPPCTTDIIAAGIGEVHIAALDPNSLVDGKGRAELEQAGVATVLGEQEEEAIKVNEAFFKWVTTGTPFVYAKFASSLDGKIATNTGESRWITGEAARRQAHRLRAMADAVMVGSNTARRDDPQLTARDGEVPHTRQPLRIVVDSRARTSPKARMLREPGQTLIAVTHAAPARARAALEKAGAQVVALRAADGLVGLPALLKELGRREIASVMVEGGGELLGSLFARRLVDKVFAFLAPVIIGGRQAPTSVGGHGIERMARALRLQDVEVERFGDDLLVSGYSSRRYVYGHRRRGGHG